MDWVQVSGKETRKIYYRNDPVKYDLNFTTAIPLGFKRFKGTVLGLRERSNSLRYGHILNKSIRKLYFWHIGFLSMWSISFHVLLFWSVLLFDVLLYCWSLFSTYNLYIYTAQVPITKPFCLFPWMKIAVKPLNRIWVLSHVMSQLSHPTTQIFLLYKALHQQI